MRSFLLAVALVAAGCAGSSPATDEIRVFATTPILGDIVRNIVGDQVVVEVLMPDGADPHSFQPSVRQVADLRNADLVIANGLDLEESILDVLQDVSRDGTRLLEVGPLADPLPFKDAPETLDPHVWLDPVRGISIAQAVAGELGRLQPAGAAAFTARQIEYAGRLEAIDRQIATQLASVANRRIVTNHDALGYFADRYDLEVIGSISPGGSSAGEPSGRDLADLADAIEEFDVNAIFTDVGGSSRLAEVLAGELDRPIAVVELFTGTFGQEGSGADTYLGLLETNGARVAEALS